jgi:hypothetical protein
MLFNKIILLLCRSKTDSKLTLFHKSSENCIKSMFSNIFSEML